MAEDWSVDVKKYVPNADPKAIAGIVRYLGIALQKRDSSLVAFSDKEEVARVRTNFLKKRRCLMASSITSSQGSRFWCPPVHATTLSTARQAR